MGRLIDVDEVKNTNKGIEVMEQPDYSIMNDSPEFIYGGNN